MTGHILLTSPSNAANFCNQCQEDVASFVKKQISYESAPIDIADIPACGRVRMTVTDRTDY